MKTFLLSAALALASLTSCQNVSTANADSGSDSGATEAGADEPKKITNRDYSITKANSYSDLFLDSVAMEKHIAEKGLDEKVARRVRSFYNARNYGFAWFTSTGLTEQARAFWNLHDYVTTYDKDTSLRDKALQKRMDALTAEEELKGSVADFAQTELTLTQHFIRYVQNNFEKGYVKRKEMERFIPYKKQDALATADSLLNKKHKDDKYFEDVNKPYGLLKQKLQRYYDVAKAGGWSTVPSAKAALKTGSRSPAVAAVKKRLQLTGEMPGTDTSQLYDDTLANAVRLFQKSLGYTPTGEVNAQLVKDMNVPVQQRLAQILVNMDRTRWMPQEPQGQLIMVNIPEFVLHIYENGQKALDMPVVVGKEGHNTVSFSGDLSTVVFSPYWNVPASIVEKEILPKMSSGYLASQDMEVVGNEDGLPKIRQRPGEKNSLGKVKFLFPNSFNIYFHDTPAKSLFAKDKRAYSHGCIRLAEPEKMAQYLLRNDPEWTPEKIAEAMNAGEEKSVKLKKTVPVMITYYTAWVDEEGILNFRDDIYSHDVDLVSKMYL